MRLHVFPDENRSWFESLAQRWRRPNVAPSMGVSVLALLLGSVMGGDVGTMMAATGVVVALVGVYCYIR